MLTSWILTTQISSYRDNYLIRAVHCCQPLNLRTKPFLVEQRRSKMQLYCSFKKLNKILEMKQNQ